MALQYKYGAAGATDSHLILLAPAEGTGGETHAIARPSSLKLAIAQAYRLFQIDEKYWDVQLKSSLANQNGTEVLVTCNAAVWNYEAPTRTNAYGQAIPAAGLRTFKVVKTAKPPPIAIKSKKRKAKKEAPRRKSGEIEKEEDAKPKVIVISTDDEEDEDGSGGESDAESSDDSESTMASRRAKSTSKRLRASSSRAGSGLANNDTFIDLAPRASRASKLILPLAGDTALNRSFGVRPTTLISTVYNAVAKELGLPKENFTLALQESDDSGSGSALSELIEIPKDDKTLKMNLASLQKKTDKEWRRFELYVCKVEIEIE